MVVVWDIRTSCSDRTAFAPFGAIGQLSCLLTTGHNGIFIFTTNASFTTTL
jgi:hypothetical protein